RAPRRSGDPRQPGRGPGRGAGGERMQKQRILIVEDDDAVRLAVSDFLESHGYEADEAETVRSAEMSFRVNRPDAVLMDYSLPDGTALDLLARLKLIDGAVPTVVLTGNATIDLAVRAIKEGAQNFLESELFGHEKGAFTGAIAAKQGLLEVGHRGTVFLDEIGDVDPLVQPKLLKVLEEKTFRRLGDVRDRRVDIRLIAATHHD